MSTFISSSSSSPSSLEEGSSRTCVGAVPRDLSLYDIMSGIRWLLLHSNTVCCTILSVERCSLENTSQHRDKMSTSLQEYFSVLYYTILYYTKCFTPSQQYLVFIKDSVTRVFFRNRSWPATLNGTSKNYRTGNRCWRFFFTIHQLIVLGFDKYFLNFSISGVYNV